MKIIITERQEKLIKDLMVKEYVTRDPSSYAAKSKSVKEKLDKKYAYIPVKDENDMFGKMRWTIFTLVNGKPFRAITNPVIFFSLVQKDFPNLCGNNEDRDKMLKEILDEWLAEKKKNN